MPSSIASARAGSGGAIIVRAPASGLPQGLVYDFAYYDYTSSTPGYLYQESVQNGINATSATLLDQFTYAAQTAETAGVSVTVCPLSSQTVYPVAGGSGNQTDYADTYYSGTVQPSEETTTLPIVSTAENGSGVATTESEWFDANGNLEWSEDGNGRWTFDSYSAVTGLLAFTIQDITAGMATTLGLSPPESLPTSGINARTDDDYDPLGRVTLVLGPAFVDDAGDLVRTAT